MRIIAPLILIIVVSSSTLFAQVQFGKASFYADKFEGRLTANGENYTHNAFTAAHKLLPFGTMVKVTNLKNNKTVIVRINDRGPFIKGRIIDLSKSAAEKLAFIQKGITDVKIELINPKAPEKVEKIPVLRTRFEHLTTPRLLK